MRKNISVLFLVLVVALLLVSNVSAAYAMANKSITLVSTTYQKSGIVLAFQTTGLSKSDLKNISFVTHSHQYPIDCTFVNQTTNVRCIVSQSLSMFSGESFHGVLAGLYFTGFLPEARSFTSALAMNNVPAMNQTAFGTTSFTGTEATTDASNSAIKSIPSGTDASTISEKPIWTMPMPSGVTDVSTSVENPSECPVGQNLVYDFEWSGTAQSDGFVGTSTQDPDDFGEAYDYYTTSDFGGVLYYNYYIHNTYTFTSSGSIAPSQWDAYVQNMQNSGYTVEKTGEHCE